MTTDKGLNPLFVDISALVEYCSAYFEQHHYAQKVINSYADEGGKFVTSSDGFLALNRGMSNRERLWNYLIDSASTYMSAEDKTATDFKAEVLNYTSLQQEFDFDLSSGFLPDLSALNRVFEDYGLNEFRNRVDDARLQGKIQRRELEINVPIEEFDRGSRGNWLTKSTLEQYTSSQIQTNSLLDFSYWRQNHQGSLLLGSMDGAADYKPEIKDTISEVSGNDISVYTSKEVVENTTIFT